MTVALGQWAERAACIRYPADWWHSDDARDRERAASVCAECPVQRECLSFAQDWYDSLAQTRPYGIWGGVLYPSMWEARSRVGPIPIAAVVHREAS